MYIPTNVTFNTAISYLPLFLSLSLYFSPPTSLLVSATVTKYTQIMCYGCLTELDVEPEILANGKSQ